MSHHHEGCAGFEELTAAMEHWIGLELPAHGLNSSHKVDVIIAIDKLIVWEDDGLANISRDLVKRACEQVATKVGRARGIC